ncbi:MAG TPA: S1 family peptidase [Mycobacteriales bacterium]|nr:S1 family peptidase [Mycobacteriales bacterium]
MNHRSGRRSRLVALAAVGASVVAAAIAVAGANATATPARTATAPAAPAAAPGRIAAQAGAVALAQALQQRLGSRTAGSYLAADGTAVVTVTDAAAAEQVRAAGATPKLVARGVRQLAAVAAGLRRHRDAVGTAWRADPASDQVVVTVTPQAGGPQLTALLATVRRYGAAVRVQRTATAFRPLISGGDAILTGGARCSLGFNVRDADGATFFLTAGHCTNIGDTWTTTDGTLIGQRAASSFPGDDFGVVSYTGTEPAEGTVGDQDITEAATPTVGQQACRTGSTTGLHCGSILALDATVNYAEGTVTGLIETDICAEPGDSGGPLFADSTALGLTSGGSGDCRVGGTTFFQPVTEPLERFGLSVF